MTSDDKYFQQAYRVYMNLIWLNGEVGPGAGDVAGGADFRADRHVGQRDGDDREGSERARRADYKTPDGARRPGVQPRDRRRDHAAVAAAVARSPDSANPTDWMSRRNLMTNTLI